MRQDVKNKALSDDPETFLEDCLDSYGNGCGSESTVLFRLNDAEYDYIRYHGKCDECGMEHLIEYTVEGISAMNINQDGGD